MSDLSVAAPGIERSSTSFGIEGVETNGIGWPGSGHDLGLLKQQTANPFALQVGMDSHAGKIQRPGNRSEIRRINGPRLFGGQAQSSYDAASIPRYHDLRKLGLAQIVQHSLFS